MGGDVVRGQRKRHGRLDQRVLIGLPDLHAEHDDHRADVGALVVPASAAMVVVRARRVEHDSCGSFVLGEPLGSLVDCVL